MDIINIGDLVLRNCPNSIGHNSIGQVSKITATCYWVQLIEGRKGMEGWETDAWAKEWCIKIDPEPTWEV